MRYCEVFSNIFKGQKKPKIILAPGVHLIDSIIEFDFDLEIEGCGPESIVRRTAGYLLQTGRQLFQIGKQDPADGANRFLYGVKLSNFTYRSFGAVDLGLQVSNAIVISHNVDLPGNSKVASFHIDNVRFVTPEYGAPFLWAEAISIGTPDLLVVVGGTFQNVSITNCYFYNFGLYSGALINGAVFCGSVISAGATYNNIIVSNCMRDLTTHISAFTTAANFIDVIGFGPTTNGVLEANNVSID